MALGSIAVPGLIALVGVRGTVIAVAAILPVFALVRWSALRALEIGAPVEEDRFRLLRNHPIFAPLPMDTLERPRPRPGLRHADSGRGDRHAG